MVDSVPGCGGLLTAPRGTLKSPNHPDVYEHDLDCQWLIRALPNERIRFTFLALDLEMTHNCQLDYVEVRHRNISLERRALPFGACGRMEGTSTIQTLNSRNRRCFF